MGDFGAAISMTSDSAFVSHVIGTPKYMAYETKKAYLNQESRAKINWTKADVMSVAIMILNMARLATTPGLNNIDYHY